MKIALISHLYPTKLHPHYGKFIHDQAKAMNGDSDIEVDVIVPTPYSFPFTNRWHRNHSPLIKNNYTSSRLYYLSLPRKKFPSLIQLSLSNNLSSLLKKSKYDLFHIHWIYPDGLTIPLLKKKKFKTFLTIHGSDWYKTKKNAGLLKILFSCLMDSDKIIVPGMQIANDIENTFPVLSDKITIVHNFVDSKIYPPLKKSAKIHYKNKLGWSTSKINALTVANLRPEKGLDLLINTIVNNEKLKDINFQIVSSSEGNKYSKKVLKEVNNNRYKNINIYPPMNPSELLDFFRASDIYISPSRRESFGLAMTEAAFIGVPVISTDVGIASILSKLGYAKILSPEDFNLLNSKYFEDILSTSKADVQELKSLLGKTKFVESMKELYVSTLPEF